MSKKLGSKKWFDRHVNDKYVQKSKEMGYRSRAAFKLIEIQKKFKLIKAGQFVIELGSAPGSWTQILQHELKLGVNLSSKLIAVDMLPMEPLDDVTFIHGDFNQDEIILKLNNCLKNKRVNLVLSDMAPNMCGNKLADQLRIINLSELCLSFAKDVLLKHGSMLLKIFHGSGSEQFIKEVRTCFKKVYLFKPDSSRTNSSEIYLFAEKYLAI